MVETTNWPWHLDKEGVLRFKATGYIVKNPTFNGKQYSIQEIIQALTQKKLKMTVFSDANCYYIRRSDGEVHSTRYPTRDRASASARKMVAGLLQFLPIAKRVAAITNYSNKL
jgi:arginine/lysine/ornithine decarboxylase